jgi:histidine triad (HIT) family protein
MTDDCIFCKIAKREIKSTYEYETENCIVIHDIKPLAPIDLLIIPKKHIPEFCLLTPEDNIILKDLYTTIQKMITVFQLNTKGYRIAINGGGTQLVNHFHVHLSGKINKTKEL